MNKPKWASKAIEGQKGVSALLIGNQYVAVQSTRVMGLDGKRQTVKTKMGLIVPNGIITADPTASVKEVQIYEYGMSKAIFDLCPIGWKNHVSTLSKYGWLDVLATVISFDSPNSFLLWRFEPHMEKGRYYGACRKSLEDALPMKILELKELFGAVQFVIVDGQKMISQMSAETKREADRLGVNLEELF